MYVGDYIRMRYVSIAIPKPNDRTAICLDVGCGEKLYKDLLTAKGYNWKGIDKNPIDKEVEKVDLDDTNLNINTEKLFDLIICVDVLEHLEYPVQVIRLLSTLLRRNGTLIIHTPNIHQTHPMITPVDNEDHKRLGFESGELIKECHRAGLHRILVTPTFNWNEAVAWDINYALGCSHLFNDVIDNLIHFDIKKFIPYGILLTARK